MLGAIGGVLLLAAVIFGLVIRAKREQFIRQIRGLRRECFEAEMRVQDLKSEVSLRRARVDTLRKEVESLQIQKDKDRSERLAEETPPRSALDFLQDIGRLDAAGIAKAQAYLDKTLSEQPLEKALVVLGIVSPEDMNGAVRDAAAEAARKHK